MADFNQATNGHEEINLKNSWNLKSVGVAGDASFGVAGCLRDTGLQQGSRQGPRVLLTVSWGKRIWVMGHVCDKMGLNRYVYLIVMGGMNIDF
ncbi:hypothetical protein V6N11_064914 [Hibiscus sabdariffa]|uniref:Uncharacterized protein n=2 Tax=Hibiscus sabdariffa TaxID=183260 RepID=A0ABR1ZED7_9ROSI